MFFIGFKGFGCIWTLSVLWRYVFLAIFIIRKSYILEFSCILSMRVTQCLLRGVSEYIFVNFYVRLRFLSGCLWFLAFLLSFCQEITIQILLIWRTKIFTQGLIKFTLLQVLSFGHLFVRTLQLCWPALLLCPCLNYFGAWNL